MASVKVAAPNEPCKMNFSKFIPIPAESNRFLAYIKYILNAAKRHAISRKQPYGIDITGPGSYFIKLSFGAWKSTFKEIETILGDTLKIVRAESRDYIICDYSSPDQTGHEKCLKALDILGAWFREMIGGNKRYDARKNLSHFINVKKPPGVENLDLKIVHQAAGGKSLLAHRTMFCLVPNNAKCLPRALPRASAPKDKDLQWPKPGEPNYKLSEGDVSFDDEVNEEQRNEMITKAEELLGVKLSRVPISEKGRTITCTPFDHQLIEHCEESNRQNCEMAFMILEECVAKARYLREQRRESRNVLECLFELEKTESNMTLKKLYEAAVRMRQEWTSESIRRGTLAMNNGNDNGNARMAGYAKSKAPLSTKFYTASATGRALNHFDEKLLNRFR